MSIYGEVAPPSLSSGYAGLAWDNETVAVGGSPDESSSQAFGLHRSSNAPSCVSVEILFGGDPGAFQVDLQCADTNEEECFVTKGSLDTGRLNDSFVGRIEATNIVAKYVRLRMVTLTNPVSVTARFF
jgi:hypothetical protein